MGLIQQNWTEGILPDIEPIFKKCNFILKFMVIAIKCFLLCSDELFASGRVEEGVPMRFITMQNLSAIMLLVSPKL